MTPEQKAHVLDGLAVQIRHFEDRALAVLQESGADVDMLQRTVAVRSLVMITEILRQLHATPRSLEAVMMALADLQETGRRASILERERQPGGKPPAPQARFFKGTIVACCERWLELSAGNAPSPTAADAHRWASKALRRVSRARRIVNNPSESTLRDWWGFYRVAPHMADSPEQEAYIETLHELRRPDAVTTVAALECYVRSAVENLPQRVG